MTMGSLVNAWQPEDAFVLDALRDARFGELRLVLDSSNYVFLAELEHPEYGQGLGIYKPSRGERPLSDFPYGTLHHREVAAFEFSRLLGWDIVPPTVEREGPEGAGSLQLFIEHDPREHYFVFREDATLAEQLVRLAVFDLVANNADRKGGHILRDAGRRLWAIDNGLCFHWQEKLRTVIWDFAGTEIPQPLLDALARVCADLETEDLATEALRARIKPREITALARRIEAFLRSPVLPEMYPWRCTPWPLV